MMIYISMSSMKCPILQMKFCSICSVPIKNFIPDYFLGEKINSACSHCRDNSFDDDPFSSFASSDIPPSLASHWTLPVQCSYGNLGSISSLRAHYVMLPNPGSSFISKEEVLREFRAMMEELRKEFRESFQQL